MEICVKGSLKGGVKLVGGSCVVVGSKPVRRGLDQRADVVETDRCQK